MIEPFLTFWTSPANKPPDNAEKMALGYIAERERLKGLKNRTLEFLVPANNGKAWHPAFDPGRIPEVAVLASEIEQSSTKLESIANDIEAFLTITGGRPTMIDLVNERDRARQTLNFAARKAGHISRKTIEQSPSTPLEQVQELPEVKAAYDELKATQDSTTPKIAALEDRLSQLRAILNKYEVS